MTGCCRKGRRNWRRVTGRSSPRCATAPMRTTGCGPSRRSGGRSSGVAEGRSVESDSRPLSRRLHLLVTKQLFLPRRFAGRVIVAQGGAIGLGDVAVGRNGAGCRAAGHALFAQKLSNRRGIFILGHGGNSLAGVSDGGLISVQVLTPG